MTTNTAADVGLPPAPAIWCSGMRKRYGRRPAVDEVSLEVGRGEVVGLLGPNGAGKTTVIKMLLGRPAADPAARARVGYLPELFRYQPWLSAAEVVALHVRLSGIDFATARDYLLSLPGIPADVATKLRTFSADGSTLPLPIPADQVSSSSAKVNGHQATVLTTRDKALAAVVWVSDGEVTAVAGSLSKAEVLDVARSLR